MSERFIQHREHRANLLNRIGRAGKITDMEVKVDRKRKSLKQKIMDITNKNNNADLVPGQDTQHWIQYTNRSDQNQGENPK